MPQQSAIESLDTLRVTPMYEWALAILVINCTGQFYRLIAQFFVFVYNILKLNQEIDVFWPLTRDDLRPHSQSLILQSDAIQRLIECLVLSLVSFYSVWSLLNYAIIGLVICSTLFTSHSLVQAFSISVNIKRRGISIFNIEFAFWLAMLIAEIATVVISVIFIVYFGSAYGIFIT